MLRQQSKSTLFPYTTLFRSLSNGAPGLSISRSAARLVRQDRRNRSEEHTSELQSPDQLVCRHMLEKKNKHRAPCAHPSCAASESCRCVTCQCRALLRVKCWC